MILDANSPVGFVPVWKKNEETGEYEESDQPLNIDEHEFTGMYNACKSIHKYSQDLLVCVDGDEGSGKSIGATQKGAVFAAIMRKLTRRSTIHFKYDQITYDSQEFMDMCLNLPDWTPIMIDETKEIANRKRSMGKEIVKLENFLSLCRARHKIIIIVLPKIQDLTSYLSEHRIKMLFHYFHRFNKKTRLKQPGWYAVHGEKNCKQIAYSIRKGQKNWYPRPKISIKRGMKHSCVDNGALEKKKDDNLNRFSSKHNPKTNKIHPEIRKKFIKDMIKRTVQVKIKHKLTNKAICALLGISEPTYYSHKKEVEEETGLLIV